MNKFNKLYNLIMEDINPVKREAWAKKLDQYPQFSAAWHNEMWDSYVNRWAQWYWKQTPEEIEALTDEEIGEMWETFIKEPHNWVDFWMGELNADPQKHKRLYWQVRHSTVGESVLTESCFDDGTYDELYEWYDQELVSAVLDVLSKYDQFLPPRTVARLINDSEIKEEFEKGKLKDLSEGFILYKINPRYNAAYGWQKYNK